MRFVWKGQHYKYQTYKRTKSTDTGKYRGFSTFAAMKKWIILGVSWMCAKSCFAQEMEFQSFPPFNIAVECNCHLQKGETSEELMLSGMRPLSGQKAPVLRGKSYAYNCKNNSDIKYRLEIIDKKDTYKLLSLDEYNKTAQHELEKETIYLAKSGGPVQWLRIEGVYGIMHTFYFDDLGTYTFKFLKNGIEYHLSVSGRDTETTTCHNDFIKFFQSFKMI